MTPKIDIPQNQMTPKKDRPKNEYRSQYDRTLNDDRLQNLDFMMPSDLNPTNMNRDNAYPS